MTRNAIAKRVRFFMLDCYSALPLFLLGLYPRMVTLYITIGFSVALLILERAGMTLPIFARWLRSRIIGRHRLIRPMWRCYR